MIDKETLGFRLTFVLTTGGRPTKSLLGGESMRELVTRYTAALTGAIALMTTSAASAQVMADPAGSGPLVGAVHWLQGTLLGTVSTVVAVIAVATVGFLMLMGRINWRYGATVIVGCFILFGAASIVGGIQSTALMSQ
jgi:type IV secretion system protein VirB2